MNTPDGTSLVASSYGGEKSRSLKRQLCAAVWPFLSPGAIGSCDGQSPSTSGRVGLRTGGGTCIEGASVPPSISNTLPVTHDEASETR